MEEKQKKKKKETTKQKTNKTEKEKKKEKKIYLVCFTTKRLIEHREENDLSHPPIPMLRKAKVQFTSLPLCVFS